MNIFNFLKFTNSLKNINYNQSVNNLLKSIDISDNKTPLELAIHYHLVDEVETLLEKGADPNQVTEDGVPLLFKASFLNNPNLVYLLVKHGADIRKKDKEGNDIIHYTKNENIVNYLKFKGL